MENQICDVKSNILRLNEEIQNECQKFSIDFKKIKLMAVSKTKPIEYLKQAFSSGQILFGENYVQEINSKFSNETDFLKKIDLHLIGHLQTNKVKKVLPFVTSIDSVDSYKLLSEINKESQKLNKTTNVLLEYNTAKDGEKTGILSEDEVFSILEKSEELKNISINGFLTIGVLGGNESIVRSCFSTLRNLRDKCSKEFPNLKLNVLSMGMSSDWKWALREGSTMIRIGSSIFGKR